jgi:calcium-activated chloride channel regulator 4
MRTICSKARRAFCAPLIVFLLVQSFSPGIAHAGGYWFSGTIDPHPTRATLKLGRNPFTAKAGSAQLFDVVVSLHGHPTGDDNGNTQGDPASVDQDKIESILQYFADGVYESSEGTHKIRKIRIFRDRRKQDKADVVWEPSGHPQAKLNGIAEPGLHISMFDIFHDDPQAGQPVVPDHDMLNDAIGAGYTLAHEWAHYAYGLIDEYPQKGVTSDVPVRPSMMTSQWMATGGDTRWLNYSIAYQGEPPGDFQNTRKTPHHRYYKASGWEVLAKKPSLLERLRGLFSSDPVRVFYPTLQAVAPAGTATPHFPDLPGSARGDLDILWMKNDLSYEIVIDRSGSMTGTKIENAKTAAKLLVDLAPEGTSTIGVIAFDSSPGTIAPLTPITGQAARDSLKSAIDSISAGGGTSIGAAAQSALDTLLASGVTNDTKAVFLLSDGLSGDNALAPVPAYVSNQVPILAFSYGGDADTSTLGQMATATKGRLFISPVALADVSQAFQAASALATGQASVASGGGTAGGNSPAPAFQVDSTMARLTLAVTHQGGPGAAAFELIDPAGAHHAPMNVSPSGGETLSFFDVAAPAAGSWRLQGTAGSPVSFQYQASAEPSAAGTYALAAGSTLGDVLHYPEPLVLSAALGRQMPIAGAAVSAVVTAPDGTESFVPLADNGVAPDETAGDGRYAAIVPCDQSGVYDVTVRAEAAAGTARLTATGLEMSSRPDGIPVSPPADQPIPEAFQRFERFQVMVDGVVADDHGNTPAASTPIAGTNEDPTPGRIERGGDVDVFSFPVPAGASTMVVRVTGLALVMSPSLRVLAGDGVTVLGQGTLATRRTAGGYLAVEVPATPGSTLYAEVRHNDAVAGTGFYRISAGPPTGADDPVPGLVQPDVVGALTASGRFAPGGTVTYTLTLTNRGTGPQEDRPGHELVNVLPPELALLSAAASAGVAAAEPATNTVVWDGAIPAGATVTLTLQASIKPGTVGRTVTSQGTIAYDGDGLGLNWSTRRTDDPATPAAEDATSFVIANGVSEIPTLSELGLVILCLLLAGLGLAVLRRRTHPPLQP